MVSTTRKAKRSWGYHLIVNAGGCDPAALRSKTTIAAFSKKLVDEIDMVAYGKPMIVMFGTGNKKGYSLVQLIETSNITGHFVEETNDIYLDIFSCKVFKEADALRVFHEFFSPKVVETTFLIRQARHTATPTKNTIRRLAIAPNTFEILKKQENQNPYITEGPIDKQKALNEHISLEHALPTMHVYSALTDSHTHLPDIVFVANGGLSLPRLKEPLVILPWMKYAQRRDELPHLKDMFKSLGIKTIEFPGSPVAPFEGQAELKWFHGGTKAICAYGFRSSKKTFEILDGMLKKIYTSNGLSAPELLVLPIASFDYYHLDVGMLEYDDAKCIVHKQAFSPESVQKMREFLGPSNVHVLDTTDTFCLNAVVDGKRLITHRLAEKGLKAKLEKLTNKKIVEVDTSKFEKSGGSVRCMILDIHL